MGAPWEKTGAERGVACPREVLAKVLSPSRWEPCFGVTAEGFKERQGPREVPAVFVPFEITAKSVLLRAGHGGNEGLKLPGE